jgi:hypothetical protein
VSVWNHYSVAGSGLWPVIIGSRPGYLVDKVGRFVDDAQADLADPVAQLLAAAHTIDGHGWLAGVWDRLIAEEDTIDAFEPAMKVSRGGWNDRSPKRLSPRPAWVLWH